ncbi:potassium channel family protein [Peribacillus acanthi]|uniref:potassium channel family protein n=1 Tax=Peribacillus acanthi TaxID=2171554 RepID=UPI000D3EB34F|nr:potassium channel family protein [Peribacillus acanthi]
MLGLVRYITSRVPTLLRLFVIVSILICFFGWIIHYIEPESFPTYWEGIWWAVVTTSTVGFGDYAPKTVAGQVVGVLLIITGAGFVTTYFVSLAAIAVKSEESFMHGKLDYNRKDHTIVVGWNERSRVIIDALLERQTHPSIVLIDQTLQDHPLRKKDVHFIKGNATSDEILKKANVQSAESVIITADFQQNEFQTDMFSILALLSVKGLNPRIFCIVEILTTDQVANAYRAGADRIIQTNSISSKVILDQLKELTN